MSSILIRPARPYDVPFILRFITELAQYEKAGHEVEVTEESIHTAIFAEGATAYALMCMIDQHPAGFAVYFYNYSTWKGKHGIYLEDLYLLPQYRNKGAGKTILQYLAQLALAKDCVRLEWGVLDWNQPAIEFYQSIGARPQDEWTTYRLSGKELIALAKQQIVED